MRTNSGRVVSGEGPPTPVKGTLLEGVPPQGVSIEAGKSQVSGDTQVTATVGAVAVTGKVTLKTKRGTATAPGSFTVN